MNETGAKKPAVDWAEVRKRVEVTRLKIEQGWAPGLEERKKILRQRAAALAKEPERIIEEEKIEVIEFFLTHERYGIESSYVREVYPLKDLTPVPCTPPFVLGIINVRGRILSVTDLKKFFNLPEKGLGDLNKVLILSSDDMEFGILADSIAGVRTVPVAGLQKSLPTLTGVGEEYLKGVAGDGLIVLDAGRILSDKAIIVNEEV
ncbi:MAG: chemotaxis protein CheW [Nitrospirae bacterium]|nr:chemotaxis protein CheW [Nitrospirota bacterium]